MEIVAVTENVPTAGAIVWWRLRGIVKAQKLIEAWDAQGLDLTLVPTTPSRSVALRRAALEQATRRRLVRSLSGGGFAIVNETVKATEVDYEFAARIYLHKEDESLVVQAPYKSLTEDETQFIGELRDQVRGAFRRHLGELSSEDISAWLVKLMPQLDAVALRDSGGIYFIPRHRLDKLARIIEAVRTSTEHVINRVPALSSEEAVNAILDAIDVEATAEVSSMERELADETLGKRALENRAQHCEQVEAKVARYEDLLGRRLDVLRERLEGLRANLVVAMVKTGAADGLRQEIKA